MIYYVFGYGSLISAESLSRGLQRTVGIGALIPAWLVDFSRTWSVKEQVFSDHLGRVIDAVFLNVEAQPGARTNGVLAQLNRAELEYLKKREKNYACLDITPLIIFDPGGNANDTYQVFTFSCTGEHKVDPTGEGLYVMRRYVAMVEAACLSLGEAFYQDYLHTTQPVPFELVEGTYSFVDAAQMKYA